MSRELRIACTVAQMEREGGISPRLSPLAQVCAWLHTFFVVVKVDWLSFVSCGSLYCIRALLVYIFLEPLVITFIVRLPVKCSQPD